MVLESEQGPKQGQSALEGSASTSDRTRERQVEAGQESFLLLWKAYGHLERTQGDRAGCVTYITCCVTQFCLPDLGFSKKGSCRLVIKFHGRPDGL